MKSSVLYQVPMPPSPSGGGGSWHFFCALVQGRYVPQMKTCSRCKTEKPYTEFYGHKGTRDGYGGWCKNCSSENSRQWTKNNPERVRELNRKAKYKSNYGMTPEEYEALLAKQDSRCAICGGAPGRRRLHVDHCHESSKVRGLLCHGCNIGLGMFQDNPELLAQAIRYLA